MFKINVRHGTKEEIDQDKFMLFTEDNDGDTIIVAENEIGDIVGFAQLYGEEIGFIESIEKGAGVAMVDYLKSHYDHLVAINADGVSKNFWIKMGFELCGIRRYEWYAEEL